MNVSTPPPPQQSCCANCARTLPLKLVLADNGRRYWLCGGCEAGMCKSPLNPGVARLPLNRFSENPGPRPSTPSGSTRAPTMDEQERRLLRRAEHETTFAEEIEALKRKWGSR